MIVNLKPETILDIEKNGLFEQDGCACGDFYYKLGERLWLTVYRSCRKSNNTPDHKLWELHEVVFYDEVTFSYYERDGKRHVDGISEFGACLENVKMNLNDQQTLYSILKKMTKESYGNEFRNED